MRATIALCFMILAVACTARAEDDMFPFPVQTLSTSSDATDMSWMNECPAGRSGFVGVKDGHFVDGAGKRIRFMGFSICGGGSFPEHADADIVAARLAKLGVNIVRLHHADITYAPKGIWDPRFKDKQHIDAGQLEKLDYFIAALKKHGIYTDLNLHVSRQFTAADGFPETANLTKYDKGVDNFEPRMVQLQKNYAKDFLTHANPYTGTRYADEPAIAIVEINNENSLLEYCINGTIDTIPGYYKAQLRKLWNDWLRKRYASTADLRKAWGGDPEPIGDNILLNADLSQGTGNWELQAPSPAKATLEVTEGPEAGTKALRAGMTREGTESWHFQVHQIGLDLTEEKPYVLRFRARANQPRKINVTVQLDVDDWHSLGLAKVIELPANWKSFELNFRASRTQPRHARLSFNLGNFVGDVWIAGVELRPGGGGGLPATASLEAGNIGLPGDAYTAAQRRDYLSFAAETERDYAKSMYDYIKTTLGSKSLVVDTQVTYGGIGGMYRESLLDFADIHGYWQHPSFPDKPWDPVTWRIGNTPMVSALGIDTLTRMAMCRLEGKPFTVSEYNHPAPNDYSAECVPMLAAFAALQDWDGIIYFDYHSALGDWDRNRISSYFDCDSHPAKIALMPAAAAIFRRADVAPIGSSTILEFPVSLISEELRLHGAAWPRTWEACGFTRTEAASARVAARFTQKTDKASVKRTRSSATPSVVWTCEKGKEKDATFIIDSPASKGVIGFASAPVKLQGLTIEPLSGQFSAIAVTSLDGKPVGRSTRLLIAAVGRAENTGMVWNETRTSVSNKWGTAPVMAQGIAARIAVDTGAAKAQAYALDGGGGRLVPVPCNISDGQLKIELGPQWKTLWYEVVIDR